MNIETVESVANIAEKLVRVVAIVIAAVWTYRVFVKRRQPYPRAELTSCVTTRPVSGQNQILVRLKVTIKNRGDVLLKLRYADVRISRVLPVPDAVVDSINSNSDPVPDNSTFIPWPLLGRREWEWSSKGKDAIEPGDTTHRIADFVVPTEVQTVESYAFAQSTYPNTRWTVIEIEDIRHE